MTLLHADLKQERWFLFSLMEQLANIGSEVFRTISWRDKNKEISQQAFERSLELFDLTIEDAKNRRQLKEIIRCRELWCDYIVGDNQYQQNDTMWKNYFFAFTWGASKKSGK